MIACYQDGGDRNNIFVYDTDSCTITANFCRGERYTDAADLSPDGNYVASININKLIIWNVLNNSKCNEVNLIRGSYIVTFVPKTNQLLTEYDNDIALWDIKTLVIQKRFKIHSMNVNSVAVTSDGRFALTGGQDNKGVLWDIRTGRILYSKRMSFYAVVGISGNNKRGMMSGNNGAYIFDMPVIVKVDLNSDG